MKRPLFNLSVFLLLGAIINVAVAWGCAWESPPWFTRYSALLGDFAKDEYVASILAGSGHPIAGPTNAREREAFGFRTLSVEPGLRDVRTGQSLDGVVFAWYGLPLLTMSDEVWWNAGHPECVNGLQTRVAPGPVGTIVYAFPLKPLWPGFAINTIFYAATLWMLFAAPFEWRRRRRIKRGLCPACAYPIGEASVCTECGKALKR